MPSYSREAIAAGYATALQGQGGWAGWCQKFVENAYGTTGQYRSAVAAGDALLKNGANTDLKKAKPGDLVFFAADDTNDRAGHVGIYLGDGKMISATYAGVRVDSLSDPYWQRLFRGTTAAPQQWKGVDPAKIENATVRETALTQAQRFEQIRTGTTMSDTTQQSTLDRLRANANRIQQQLNDLEKSGLDPYAKGEREAQLSGQLNQALAQIAAEENRLRDDARGTSTGAPRPGETRNFTTVINGELREGVPHEWVPDPKNPKGGEWQPIAGQQGTKPKGETKPPVQTFQGQDGKQYVFDPETRTATAIPGQGERPRTYQTIQDPSDGSVWTYDPSTGQRGQRLFAGKPQTTTSDGFAYPNDPATGLPDPSRGVDVRNPDVRRQQTAAAAAAEFALERERRKEAAWRAVQEAIAGGKSPEEVSAAYANAISSLDEYLAAQQNQLAARGQDISIRNADLQTLASQRNADLAASTQVRGQDLDRENTFLQAGTQQRGQDMTFAQNVGQEASRAAVASLPFVAPRGTSEDISAILGGANPASRPARSMPMPFDPVTLGRQVAEQVLRSMGNGAGDLISRGSGPATPFQMPSQAQLPPAPPPIGIPQVGPQFVAPVAPGMAV